MDLKDFVLRSEPVKPAEKYSFSPDQQAAYEYAISAQNHNCFLTGEAGSGKSYLTTALRAFDPAGSVLCATTGQAAQLIGGRTIHSFIGLVPHRGLISPRSVEDRICACKRLYIDEISMLSDVNLDYVFTRFEDLNHWPQIIPIGDFHQLPPVDRDDDPDVSHQFAFKSRHWKNIKMLKLSQQHRQADPEFTGALNDIRVGKTTQRVVELVFSRTVGKLPDDCTQIFPLRAEVDTVNRDHVLGLKGGIDYFQGIVVQRDEKNAPIDKNRFRLPLSLHLKPGCRIVMLTNDKAGRWANGSTGIIHSAKIDIKVVLDNGYEGPVERVIEEQYNGSGAVMGSLQQFPLMLGKALTVHKAQGMSLTRVGVGVSRLFEYGHAYVALSRATTKSGLFITGAMPKFKVNQEVLEFYRSN